MLYYDSFFTIGKTHLICQDYIEHGENPLPFILLSDGCSASPRSDVGARILVLTAKHLFENKANFPIEYRSFGYELIQQAIGVTEKLRIPASTLDATMMIAFLYQEVIYVYVYGDGCLLFKDCNGKVGTIEIAFTHNAPYYLSYWSDTARQQEYAKHEEKPLIISTSVGDSENLSFQAPLSFQFPLEKFQAVAIASDGASQCMSVTQGIKVPLREVAENLLFFKSLEGEFVKRRIRRTLENYAKQGIYPIDDLSIGVFVHTLT